MESDLHNQNQNQFQQMNSRLTRYRSAPSSYFANFIEENVSDEILNRRPLSPETEQIFAGFLSAGAESGTGVTSADNPGQNSLPDYSSVPPNFYQNQSPMKSGGGNNSNLLRQTSSPAGLLSDLIVENGLLTIMEESGNKNMGERIPAINGGFVKAPYVPDFPMDSWDDSHIMSENVNASIRADDKNTFSAQNQKKEAMVRRPPLLAHHLSLPNTTAEISAIEKMLQFPDSVPCKIRAKRGFATHPRSIAERVRRTRISERMRKLQELVPNMDKQTNTADMLDLAVEYIKDLQQNVKTLSDKRAKCSCSSRYQL